MRKALAVLALTAASAAQAQAPNPPALIIVISVDQFSADLFDEYRPHFTAGLKRLAGGTVFRNGYQSHATTETCPGHSTILTGAHPARTGIVSNLWGDAGAPRADKTVYCAEDERVPGTSSSNYAVSSLHLQVPTLGDVLKRLSPDSQNVAVAGKDRSAVMMSGHAADQRWYWTGKGFATDLKSAPVPRSIPIVNAGVARLIAAGQPPLVPPPFCQTKAQPFTLPSGRSVGAGRLERAAGDSAGVRSSPELDGATLALAAGLVQDLKLGRDRAPDILSVSLSATDYVGHTYGTGGQEMCLQLFALDREMGDFFKALDSMGIDYAVALTADHGGLDIPERLRARGVADAARVSPDLTAKAIGAAVSKTTGIAGPVLVDIGVMGDMYLDPALKGRDRQRALDAALAAYRAHPQVAGAFSKQQIASVAMPAGDPVQWTLLQRVRASFDPHRSGDLYVALKPHIMPIIDTKTFAATHGSPWDYDRRVPILFWRRGMSETSVEQPAETVDIMPTLAALIGIPAEPGRIDGHCLSAIQGIRCPAR
jgi:predicted AlkP superfamily pyrophosphatase or phosphodiesterase